MRGSKRLKKALKHLRKYSKLYGAKETKPMEKDLRKLIQERLEFEAFLDGVAIEKYITIGAGCRKRVIKL